MPIKAVLFDLDNTVLDRTRTLELYLAWQADDYLNLSHDDCEQFIERFMKLDNNGMTAKEEVYAELISVFNISDHTADELTQIYREQLGRFCCEKRHIKDAVSTIKSQGFKTGIGSLTQKFSSSLVTSWESQQKSVYLWETIRWQI